MSAARCGSAAPFRQRRAATIIVAAAFGILLTGCLGSQSILSVGGENAATQARVFTVMLTGAIVLQLALNGLFFHRLRVRRVALFQR